MTKEAKDRLGWWAVGLLFAAIAIASIVAWVGNMHNDPATQICKNDGGHVEVERHIHTCLGGRYPEDDMTWDDRVK